jgi:hypothetical protein
MIKKAISRLLFRSKNLKMWVGSQPRTLGKGFTEYIIRSGETQLLNYQQMYALYEQGEVASY